MKLNNWKVNQLVQANPAVVSKVKLLDLLYESNGVRVSPRATGLVLPHSIIAHDPSIYVPIGQPNFALLDANAPQEKRRAFGIWFLRVLYDERSRPVFVPNPNYPTTPQGKGFFIEEPDASLPPDESRDFRDSTTAPLNTFNWSDLNGDFWTSSVSVSAAGSDVDQSTTVVLSGRDTAYESDVGIYGLQAFTGIRINPDPDLTVPGLLVQFLTRFGLDDRGYPIAGITQNQILDPNINTALQTTEVWVRCAFFGDYINADLFSQDLTPSSDVAFNSLVLGSNNNRFNSSNYTPTNAPLMRTVLEDSGRLPQPSFDFNGVNTYPQGVANPDIPAHVSAGFSQLPAIGNIVTQGQLVSPTIDEIRHFIKRLSSGRQSDTSGDYGPFSRPLSTSQERTSEADTSPVPETIYQLENGKEGNPLDFKGDAFINDPTYHLLQTLPSILEVYGRIIEDMDRHLPLQDGVLGDLSNAERLVNKATQSGTSWGPRSAPWSNREIEAAIQGLRFSIEHVANALASDKVGTGNTKGYRGTSGTLHQLHRDYTPNLDDIANTKNTTWVDSKDSTTKEEFDFERSEAEQGVRFGDHLPQSDDDFFNPSRDQTPEGVFLASDSTWSNREGWVRLPAIWEED